MVFLLNAKPCVTECASCKKKNICTELDLPVDYNADACTALHNRGGLIFVTPKMFETFQVIEKIIESYNDPSGKMYSDNSFQECISKVSPATIIPLFCDDYRVFYLPYLIREYVAILYHFESKRLKFFYRKIRLKSNQLLKKSRMNVINNQYSK